MRRTVQAAVGVIGFSLAVVPAASRDAGSWGGEGGGPFRTVCPRGTAWFAYYAKAGKALNAFNLYCQDVLPNKTTSGSREIGGGPGTNVRDGDSLQRTCPPNSVITGMLVGVDGNRMVSKFDITCTNLQTRATSVQRGRTEGIVRVNYPVNCAPDEVAVGAYGRYGALIDQLGLVCEKLAIVQPALATSQPAEPPRNPTDGKTPIKTTGQKGGEPGNFGFCYKLATAVTKQAELARSLGNCGIGWTTSKDETSRSA